MHHLSLSSQYHDLVSCICCVVGRFLVQFLAHYCGRLEKSMFCIMYTSNLMSYPCTLNTDSTSSKAEHGGSSAVLFILWYAVFMYLVISEILCRGLKVLFGMNCCLKCVFWCLNFHLIWQSCIQAIRSLRSILKGFWYQCGRERRRVILAPHWMYVVTVFTHI